MKQDRENRLVAALWWLAIAIGLAGVAVWMVKLSQPPHIIPYSSTIETVDLSSFIAAPPVPGRPSRESLDRAIEKGRKAFVEKYVVPYSKLALEGGYLDYTDANGQTTRLGPDVYFQNQLYTLVHFLMYFEELGFTKNDPLVRALHEWLVQKFDAANGRWLWSDEGCLHPKMMIALGNFGDRAIIDRAFEWSRSAVFFRKQDGLYSIMQSGFIIQTLGPADRSLSGQLAWEHKDGDSPDEENTAKYLFALLNSGRSPDSPEVRELDDALSGYLAETPLAIGYWRTYHIVGRCWLALCHQKFELPPTDGYRLCLAALRQAGRGEWRLNLMLRMVPMFRGLIVRVLLVAGERSEELDSIVHGLVEGQDDDGSWTVPHTYKMWEMDQPPKKGFKYGTFDSSNTYDVLLTLLVYRDLVMNS